MSSASTYDYGTGPTQSGRSGFFRFIAEQRKVLPYPSTSLEGLTVIVTGSNVGLGLEAARHAARLNAANLIIAVRTVSKGEAAKEDIQKSHPESKTNIVVYPLDMGSFASVKDFADKVTTDFPKIHISILNAGINAMRWNVTKDGWEQMIQVNVLCTAYLSLLLLPKLRESYDKASSFTPVLAIVASDVHYWSELKQKSHIDEKMGLLNALNNRADSDNMARYPDSKLMEVFFMRELALWIEKKGWNGEVIVTAVNPGLCKSDLAARETGILGILAKIFVTLSSPLMRTSEEGSRNYLFAVTRGKDVNGQYIGSCEVQRPSLFVTSEMGERIQKKAWEELGELFVGLDVGMNTYFE